MTSSRETRKRRLLYVANEDFAFLLNRLPMARAARQAGFEVHVATRVDKGAKAIEAEDLCCIRFRFAEAVCPRSQRSRPSLRCGASNARSSPTSFIMPAC